MPRSSLDEVRLSALTGTSVLFGFLLIPLHEFGHVVLHWMTGSREGMSYARDYLLGSGAHTFLGVLGGPLFPLLASAIATVLIYRSSISLSVLYPIAILGAFERLVLYIVLGLPSDESDLAGFLGWNRFAFEYIILSVEAVLFAFILVSMFRIKAEAKTRILCFVIPIVSFVIMAAFGVMVIERLLFPEQFHLQFG